MHSGASPASVEARGLIMAAFNAVPSQQRSLYYISIVDAEAYECLRIFLPDPMNTSKELDLRINPQVL
jgi:hypothetical protein